MTNVVVLEGKLSRPGEERVLPSGDRLLVLDLSVAGSSGQRGESVPLAWFGAPGWVVDLGAGADLLVVGRVRRRFFRSGDKPQSRTEVVVEAGAPPRSSTRVAAVMRRAEEALTHVGELDEQPVAAPGRRRRRAAPTF